ncbi:MAG TPA: aminoglycoside phosphotransferase family protein [Bauldia sp.]|nr:aminoglycoside phosphotransferase family protein [Bauldia sp.]
MDSLAAYLDRWALTRDGEPLVAATATLLPVRWRGDPALLKILSGASDEALAARALRHFAGHGAVRVLREDRGAVLLQRAVPGSPLSALVAAGHDDEATAILAEAMLRLHHGKRPPTGWPTLADWAEGFARHRARGGHRDIGSRLLDRGESAFREMLSSQGRQFLLHGDLHHDNVLRDERDGWLVIDPKGVVGESAFETAAALRNPADFFPFQLAPSVMARRVAIFAERLSLDRRRIIGWFAGQSVLSACWLVEDAAPDDAIARAVRLAEAAVALLEA